MKFFIIGFVISQIPAHLRAERYGAHFPPRRHEKQIFRSSESRYHSSQEHPSGEYSDYDDGVKGYDLPTTFEAPPYEAPDHWKNDRHHYDRRTFFDDFSHGPYGKTTAFPGVHRFVSSLFGVGDASEYPRDPRRDRNRATPPYELTTPFVYDPTEPNYIPPPKPIRASVIKLETITRSPVYPPFDYETTTPAHPHFGSLLDHVLVENSKPRRNVTWPEGNLRILPFKPLPVLPKPAFSAPTAFAPTRPEFFENGTRFAYDAKTDYRYPESVQDQLPHLHLENADIPYVSEKPIPQIFVTLPTKAPPPRQNDHAAEFSPPSDSRPTTTVFEPFDIGSPNTSGTNPNRRERPLVNFEAATVKSFPGAVEKVKRPTFKYTKKLTAQLDKSPVERVTNLTVLGFSKPDTEKAKERGQGSFPNARELSKWLNITSEVVTTRRPFNSSLRAVNFNDELSLDAKILRDTNWDGLTVPPTSSEETGTTTIQIVPRVQPKPNTTAFWEIVDEQTTFPSTVADPPETTTATEQIRFQTTTEFAFWSSTPQVVETTEPAVIEETTQRRGDRQKPEEDSPKPKKDESGQQDRVTFKRKYSRRPKIVNFTPYPTAEEIPKKLVNRSHFAKRQKPNITLAFGNKNVLKNRQSSGTDEVMKFSDEDVRKRRKIGKRRQVYRRIRVKTTGSPNQSDQL